MVFLEGYIIMPEKIEKVY